MSSRSRIKRDSVAWCAAAVSFLLSLPTPLGGQSAEGYPTFRFDGQLRLRGEADHRTVGVDADFATLSRIRGGVDASLLDWMGVYLQLQDARAWGTESNTLTDADADNFDLHQGYAELGRTKAFSARLGRQEFALADERLIGAVGWSNTGRSFDGVRLLGEASGTTWTLFWYNVAERDSLLAVGLNPQLNQGVNDDGWLLGGFAARQLGDAAAELTFLVDREALTDESYTLNLRLHGQT
ncbi:MAG: alginate export family protein, partial [Gemmatimonadales bacterium]